MGFAFLEMHKVSGLVIRDIPYEEYIPSTDELHLMEDLEATKHRVQKELDDHSAKLESLRTNWL